MRENSGNNSNFATVAPVLLSTGRLIEFLNSGTQILFSQTCKAARDASAAARKKRALKNLLTQVAKGNEAIAMEILTFHPELLLDSSATVTGLAGKKIKDLSPLQAAICAGDVDMLQMMHKVLQQTMQSGIQLGFDPESEMRRQFKAIYPDGIDSIEAEQKVKAQEFKDYMLRDIFNAINAATPEQVTFELETPGQVNAHSLLNAAFHNFRAEFSSKSNQEPIFNPFYLLMAFELNNGWLNNVGLDNDIVWNRRDLFWRQVIGYIQRHLPACYLQAFAQGVYFIVVRRRKLTSDFEFLEDNKHSMLPVIGDLDNLGYKYASAAYCTPAHCAAMAGTFPLTLFQELLQIKQSGLEKLFTSSIADRDSWFGLSRCVIA